MRWFSFTLVLFGATLLEAGNLLNLFAIGGWYIRPSILITLLVYYCLCSRTQEAIVCSFMIGFATDLTTGFMGPHTICYGLIGLLVNQSSQVILARRAVHKVIMVFGVYFVAETLSYWLGLMKGHELPDSYYSILLFTGLYSALISPVIWSILSALSGWARNNQLHSSRTYH
jgi:rod shape-determining protein MreD